MRTFGMLALFCGVLLMIFAGLAYSELRAAGTAAALPNPDELLLTKIIGPELFDPKQASARPSELAALALNRISMIGGAAIGSLAGGILILMAAQESRSALAEDDSE